MKSGKSCQVDGVSAEHLKFSNRSVYVHLSFLFNFMLENSYLPDKLMDVVLIPILKNKCGNVTDKQNYRPIAIATALSKVLELCILTTCNEQLICHENQFGYKKTS